MRQGARLLAFLLGLFAAAFVQSSTAAAAEAYRVGMVTRDYADSARRNWTRTAPRPLRTAVWYPAAADAQESETVEAGLFVGGTVAPGAGVSGASSRYPLILLSHGTGGSAVQMMWLGRRLASRGYIVAAINHHGNTNAEPRRRAEGFLLYWERPKDLTTVIDRLIADPVFGPKIDRSRIAAAGFSLGGYTVLALGGARFSQAHYSAFCASRMRDFTCEPQAEYPRAHVEFETARTDPIVMEALSHSDDLYRDRRVKAVFAIAPALGGGFTEEALMQVRTPAAVVVGRSDTVTPPATNAVRIAAAIPGARLTVLPAGVGHYTFLDDCTPRGREVLDLCRDGPGIVRDSIHQQVAEAADVFFREVFGEVQPPPLGAGR